MKKLLRFISLFILIVSLSGCAFFSPITNPSKSTKSNTNKTGKQDPQVIYWVDGLDSESNREFNLKIVPTLVRFSNDNYDEILNQTFDIKGYEFVGILQSDYPEYSQYSNKPSNLVTEDWLRSKLLYDMYKTANLHLVFRLKQYNINYADGFTYTNGGNYYTKTYNIETKYINYPVLVNEEWYDFDGTWNIYSLNNPSKVYSSFNSFIDSEDGYGDIVVTPNATLKTREQTGTVSFNTGEEAVTFDFNTANTEEINTMEFLESLNVEIPDKVGYEKEIIPAKIRPIEYVDKDLDFTVTYTPIKYTIDFSYEYTGTNGANLSNQNSIEYTVENELIDFKTQNYLDDYSSKYIKVSEWIDKETGLVVETIDPKEPKNYTLEAKEVSPVIYNVKETVGINYTYRMGTNGFRANLSSFKLSIDDFDSENKYNVEHLIDELNSPDYAFINFKKQSIEMIYTSTIDNMTYTFNSKNGYDLDLSIIDGTTDLIELYFKGLEIDDAVSLDYYVNGRIRLTRTETLGEIFVYKALDKHCRDTQLLSDTSGAGYFDATYDSMRGYDGNVIETSSDLCNSLIRKRRLSLLFHAKEYEVEYVLPEGWTTDNQTVLGEELGYYRFSDPVSLNGKGKFYGWALSPDSNEYVVRYCTITKDEVASDEVPNTVRKIYAITEEAKATLTIHNINGEEDEIVNLYESDKTYSLNMYFVGDNIITKWYFDQNFTDVIENNTINIKNVSGEIHAYTKWQTKYALRFNNKNGYLDGLKEDVDQTLYNYYTAQGFEAVVFNNELCVFYTEDNVPELIPVTYSKNNPDSVFTYFNYWYYYPNGSNNGSAHLSTGKIDNNSVSLLYENYDNVNVIYSFFSVYQKKYDARVGAVVLLIDVAHYSVSCNGDIEHSAGIEPITFSKSDLSIQSNAALEFFGAKRIYLLINAHYNCTDKIIPELYGSRNEIDIHDSNSWVTANDPNAHNQRYRRLNGTLQAIGDKSGAQSLYLTYILDNNPYYITVSQHNSNLASGGIDVYNPSTNVFITISIYIE